MNKKRKGKKTNKINGTVAPEVQFKGISLNIPDYCYYHTESISPYTLCLKKHPRHFRLLLENQLSDFSNFWHEYS